MLKAFFLDVDRTLLTDDHVVLPEVRAALRRLRARDVRIVLATARSRRALDPVLTQIDAPDGVICCNGAWIGTLGHQDYDLVFERRLDLDLARRAVRLAAHPAVLACWYAGSEWYVPADTAMVRHEIRVTGETPIITDLFRLSAQPHKLLLIAEVPEALPALDAVFAEFDPICSAAFSHRNFLELTAPAVTKATGVRELCRVMGVRPHETAAIGDGNNDLGMIASAGIGIAMGNAVDPVKRAAAWITDTNQNGGLALAIDRLIDAGHA